MCAAVGTCACGLDPARAQGRVVGPPKIKREKDKDANLIPQYESDWFDLARDSRPTRKVPNKQLMEHSPPGLCGNGSMNGRAFAERLRGWLGNGARIS